VSRELQATQAEIAQQQPSVDAMRERLPANRQEYAEISEEANRLGKEDWDAYEAMNRADAAYEPHRGVNLGEEMPRAQNARQQAQDTLDEVMDQQELVGELRPKIDQMHGARGAANDAHMTAVNKELELQNARTERGHAEKDAANARQRRDQAQKQLDAASGPPPPNDWLTNPQYIEDYIRLASPAHVGGEVIARAARSVMQRIGKFLSGSDSWEVILAKLEEGKATVERLKSELQRADGSLRHLEEALQAWEAGLTSCLREHGGTWRGKGDISAATLEELKIGPLQAPAPPAGEDLSMEAPAIFTSEGRTDLSSRAPLRDE
jgi:hypothetical protein